MILCLTEFERNWERAFRYVIYLHEEGEGWSLLPCHRVTQLHGARTSSENYSPLPVMLLSSFLLKLNCHPTVATCWRHSKVEILYIFHTNPNKKIYTSQLHLIPYKWGFTIMSRISLAKAPFIKVCNLETFQKYIYSHEFMKLNLFVKYATLEK